MLRKIVFEASAFEDFQEWAKIVTLIKDIDRSPFQGIGKPEPLKHELSGFWSRKINDEHRLVYQIIEEEIIIIACKYHYE